MNTRSIALPLLLASLAGATSAVAASAVASKPAAISADIPNMPDDIHYPPLEYAAPNRMDYRHVLTNGIVVYVVEDHGLPLVDFTITAKGGDYMDPAGKVGLSGLTADQMRSGGAGTMDADAFDQEVDFLALDMRIGSGPRESTAGINVLSKDLDHALDLLFAALQHPKFQQDRIDLYKTRVRQQLQHRNDSTTAIEGREWKRLVYGDDHFEARQVTTTGLDAMTRDDLVAFHQKVWHPGNFVIAVSGDVKAADIVAKLETRFKGWAKGPAAPPAPVPTHQPQKGIWLVDKPEVNQSRVSFGHLATTWNDPRVPTIDVMNEILGGGGFTSYLVRKVRSDEGLAYSVASVVGLGREYPKSFRGLFQSKNRSVARALDISIQQLERVRTTDPAAEDLDTAKKSLIETFPQRFNSAQTKADLFVNDEILGRPADYWANYRKWVGSVTGADVKKVASELLHPDNLTVLVIGKADEVLAGDKDHPENTLTKLAGDKPILMIPLPDPGTMVYPSEPAPVRAPATN